MRSSCLLIFIFCFEIVLAQNNSLPFINYTSREGLSHNNINCMIKDSRGYLWLGTTEGLNRFDGKHFRNYFNDSKNPASLKGNNISFLLEYKAGKILVATGNGLSIYDMYSNIFRDDLLKKPASLEISRDGRYSFFQNSKKKVFINYNGKIDVYDSDLNFLYCLTDQPWASALRGVTVYREWEEDEQGRIWLPDDKNGIQIIDEKKKQVFNYKNNPEHLPFLEGGPVRSVQYDDKTNTVYYSRWGYGLEKFNLTSKTYSIQQFNITRANEGRTINAIVKDKHGSLICCGGQDIYRVDPASLNYTIINKKTNNDSRISLARCIVIDRENTWIGTESTGLLVIPAVANYVVQFPVPFTITDPTNECSSILRSTEGLLYFAYGYDGLLEVGPSGNTIQQYKLPGYLGAKIVKKLTEDKQHRLLVGTDNGVYQFDKKNKQFSRPNWLHFLPEAKSIDALLTARDGNIWFSYTYPPTVGVYNESLQQFIAYPGYRLNDAPFFNPQYQLSKIREDVLGNIWMTSHQQGGLVCYEKKTATFKNYPLSARNKKILSDVSFTDMKPDGDSIIWLSNMYGLGLIRYNYRTDSVEHFSRKDGLLSDNILSLSKNAEGLMLAHETGLTFYNAYTHHFRSISLPDKSINWSFAVAQLYDSSQHCFVYGLNDRIIFIDENIWKRGSGNQHVYIDDIFAQGQRLNDEFSFAGLKLDHLQQNISISFSSPDFEETNKLTYAYKLEGVDKNWNETNSASANYSNLLPGNYRFLVKSKNQINNWGSVNSSLHFQIIPAFWQTLWFKLFLFLMAVGFVTWLVRRRIKYIRHQAGMKQQIAETEMMALRAQMNPHFIFNCLNSIDNLIQVNEKEKATLYLAKFAKLIRAILENSRNNVVPCWKDLETLKLYIELEELRCDKKFICNMQVADEIMNGDYKVPPLVVQPFVENAIHHGLLNKIDSNKKLEIKVTVHNNHILYCIEDNGVGRARAETYKQLNKPAHESMGMQITTARIQLFNQHTNGSVKIIDLLNEHNEPKGTRVEVELANQS